MANLNEDVLRHIFSYLETPIDWLRVSRVCKLWESAASKQWRKITEIIYLQTDVNKRLTLEEIHGALEISAGDAVRMVYYAAPSAKFLSAFAYFFEPERVIIILGSFFYKVRGFNIEETMKILAGRTSKLTELSMDHPPRTEILKSLIKRNSIKKINFGESVSFYVHVPTDEIEELSVIFKRTDDMDYFKGHFPNLKKLNLGIHIDVPTEPDLILFQILPFVHGLTNFYLTIISTTCRQISSDILTEIANFSELEHLRIEFDEIILTSLDHLLNSLAAGCPKLKIVEFAGFYIRYEEFLLLLSLPHFYVSINQLNLVSGQQDQGQVMSVPSSSLLMECNKNLRWKCALNFYTFGY